MTTIKNELIGTWEILSYIDVPIQGADSCFPLGKSPKGYLIYGADGFMSVQLSSSERSTFSSNDRFLANHEEMLSCVTSYVAFSGTYQVDNKNAVVQYAIQTSSFPNWEGQLQARKIDFEGDILYLKSIEPILSNGQYVNSYMTWKRVERDEYTSRRERFLNLTKITNKQEEINGVNE